MDGLAADEAVDFLAVASEYLDALAEDDLIPPATDGDELDEAIDGDVLHHESDFVHVAGDHDAWPLVAMRADDGTGLVSCHGTDIGKLVGEDGADLVLMAGYGMGFGEFLEKGNCFGSHGCGA